MNRAIVFLLAAMAVMLLGAGWWWRGLDETPSPDTSGEAERTIEDSPSSADLRARIAELEGELRDLAEAHAESKARLREKAVGPQGRSIEELFLFLPATFPAGDWRPAETVFEDCWFEAPDGIRLHAWFAGQKKPRAIILYLHGNAGNITHRARVVQALRKQLAASVLIFDYRGYGRSEGQPTIDGVLRDARAARDFLCQRHGVTADRVVLLGRSLGGAIAVELAAKDGARALVLESTFASLRDAAAVHYPRLGVNLLVSKKLNSIETIGEYNGPVFMSHGDADRTVPYGQGMKLFQAANEPKTFVRIRGGGHNDPPSGETYRRLQSFIESLPE